MSELSSGTHPPSTTLKVGLNTAPEMCQSIPMMLDQENSEAATIDPSPERQTPGQDKLLRREFLIAGAAAISSSALSYGRILGANERISLGHIGIGARGRELASV